MNDKFWKWFGNSVVRNSDGTPMVVYHGSCVRGLEVLRTPVYFSEDREYAYEFARTKPKSTKMSRRGMPKSGRRGSGQLIAAYLSIENPLDLRSYGLKGVSDRSFDKIMKQNGIKTTPPSVRYPYRDIPLRIYTYFRELFLHHDNDTVTLQAIKNAGYDGITFLESNVLPNGRGLSAVTWIAFHPSQIKAIDNDGSWDTNDKNIRSNPAELLAGAQRARRAGDTEAARMLEAEAIRRRL